MDLSTFEQSVIQESQQTPVLVDFWAPWCGPCQFIGPILEELYEEADGRWKLVKVNVDESPDLASKYGIRGIPNMKLFHEGAVISEQTGALPKAEFERWLAEPIPDPRDKQLAVLLSGLDPSNPEALEALSTFAEEHPDFTEAQLALAEKIIFSHPTKALDLASTAASEVKSLDRIGWIKDLSGMLIDPIPENGAVSQLMLAAQKHLRNKELEKGVANIIEAVQLDKAFQDDLPRKSSIAVFNLLGPSHPVTMTYRRKFDMALY